MDEVEVPAGVTIRSERPLSEAEKAWLCDYYRTPEDVEHGLELGRHLNEALVAAMSRTTPRR